MVAGLDRRNRSQLIDSWRLTIRHPAATVRSHAKPMNVLSATISWVIGGTAATQAVLLLWGGPDRFSSPGLAVLRQFPGGYLFWAAAAATVAALVLGGMATKNYWLKGAGLILACSWSGGFAVCVALAAPGSPVAGLTGISTYARDSIICMLMIFVDARHPDAAPTV